MIIVNFVLLVAFHCFSGTNFPPSPDQTLSLVITPAHQTVSAGSEVKIKTKLTNSSDHVVTFFDTNFDCDYPTEVRDDKGNPAPQTPYRRELKCSERLGDTRNILVTLKPQESIDEEIVVNKLYDLSRPGDYLIQVSRTVPKKLGGGSIKSNTIMITLTREDGDGRW